MLKYYIILLIYINVTNIMYYNIANITYFLYCLDHKTNKEGKIYSGSHLGYN